MTEQATRIMRERASTTSRTQTNATGCIEGRTKYNARCSACHHALLILPLLLSLLITVDHSYVAVSAFVVPYQRASRSSSSCLARSRLLLLSKPPTLVLREGTDTEETAATGSSSNDDDNSGQPTSIMASDESESSSSLVPSSSKEVPFVRRRYETFLWKRDNLRRDYYNINYRVEGPADGPPVLLVHGFGANVNHFRHQFPALVDEGYRVYAIDLLGFGASDKPSDEAYSIELFVELLCQFIHTMQQQSAANDENDENDDRQQQQWMIAGNSIGGLCSLSVAEKMSHLIQGVILFNCSGGMTGFRYEEVPLWVRPILYFVQNVLLGPVFGGKFFANFKTRENVQSILREQGVYGDPTNVDDELLEILLGPSDDEGAQEVFLKVMAGPAGPTPESILPVLQCPVLALWGGTDPWTPVDGGAHPGTDFGHYMTTSTENHHQDDKPFLDHYTLHVLPNVGHCPHDEVPDLCHSYMIPWMESVRRRQQRSCDPS